MSERPRVLILGGGFAGVGAAQKLRKADAEVVLVDRHDYHTFQPLLYQLATGLLETTAVGHSLRDLLERQDEHDHPQGHRDRHRPRRARGSVRRARAAGLRLPRPRPRRRGQLLRDRRRGRARVPDVHAAPRAAPEGSPARAVGGRRPRPGSGGRRRAQRRHRRRGTDRRGDRRGGRRALPGGVRPRLSGAPAGEGARDPGRGRAGAVLDVQAAAAQVRGEGPDRAHGRGHDRRAGLVGLADAGQPQVRRRAQGAHPGLGRRPAGQRARPVARARAPAREPHRRRAGPRAPRPPRGLRARRHRRDHGREDRAGPAPARLGGAPVRGARRRGRSPAGSPARRPSPSGTATRARWR